MSSSNTKSQQQTSTANTDNRVAVTDDGTYLGDFASLDASQTYLDSRDFSDNSQTSTQINTTDARSTVDNSQAIDNRDFSDNSQTSTVINTTDARSTVDNSEHNQTDARDFSDRSQTSTQIITQDQRQFSSVDNSQTTITTLDAELAARALETVKAAAASQAATLENAFITSAESDRAALAANASLAAQSITAQQAATAAAFSAQGQVVDSSLVAIKSAYADASAKAQSGDTQISQSLIKYGAAAASLVAAIIIFNRRK